jgi:uncharacterized membrane protein YhaH (DUF805 family)
MNWFVTALKRYARLSGRAGRPEYWYFILIYLLASALLSIVDGIVGTYNAKAGIGLLSGLWGLALLVPWLAVSVRRLHDIGRSGWWVLIGFVPLVGFVVLLVFACTRSEPAANRYGAGPGAML